MRFFEQFTEEQMKRQYAANTECFKRMLKKAQQTGKNVNGYTADDLQAYYTRYTALAQ